ncbi:MAG TPA: hypothetical protein VGC06_14250 [Actinomycetes bacterium]
MGEATYRWICTYCETSDVAESPEMAKLAVDVHVSLFHGPTREGIRTQSGPEGNVLIQQGEGPAASSAPRPSAKHSPNESPASITPARGNWWRALVNLVRRGRHRP